MPLELTVQTLREIVANLHFANDGDAQERQYWPLVMERFPNCERFWRDVVVPLTKRIERELGAPDRHERREGVSEDIWIISYLSYSLFLHLAAAYDHLPGPVNSSPGDFYTHLGSACDLAEDFFLNAYLVITECRGEPVPELQQLSKQEFLDLAAEWYDKRYAKLYENYHQKGKGSPVYLPPRTKILTGYFDSARQAWEAYEAFANTIRPYRNRIVHDVAIGNVLVGKIYMVPRKGRIQDYRSIQDVQAAAQHVEKLKRDFIVREEQMINDLQELQQHLNALWDMPLADLTELLYKQKNPRLQAKYNLRFV